MIHVAPSNEAANWNDPTEAEVRATNGAFAAALGDRKSVV